MDGKSREYFLGELRQARLAAQKNAESFDELLFVFERFGCFCLRFQAIRYIYDPDCFLYTANFADQGGWRRFVFYVNDVREPGTLVVEDVEYKPK